MSFLSLNYSGDNIDVIAFAPEWEPGIGLTLTWPSVIDVGLSGREERAPEADSPRFNLTVTLVLEAAEAHALRAGLASLGDKLVGVPLWPDRLAGADWATRIFSPETILDITNGEIRPSNYSLVAGDLYAPLLAGHLNGLPQIRPHAADGLAELVIELQEDSPWSWRVGINATGTAGTWPATLSPNWGEALADLPIDGLSFEEISLARMRGVRGSDVAFRWGQKAPLFLEDRSAIRSLLAFWVACKGMNKPFDQPWWYKPGADTTTTPHTTKARFEGETLKLSFLTDGMAAALVSVVQLPWEVSATAGETPEQAPRAFFYKITHAIPSPEIWRFTNWEADLVRASDGTYTAERFTHGEIVSGLALDSEEVSLRSWNFTGNPLLKFIPWTLEAKLTIEIREGDPSDPDAAALVWAGEITSGNQTGEQVNARARFFGGVLERQVPGFLVQHGCNWSIYSQGCTLLKADFEKAGTFTSAAGNVLTITTAAAEAAGTFFGGWIGVGSGSTWERRAIKNSAPGSGIQTITVDRAIRQSASGQTVKFYRGCDGLPGTCQALSNFDNYGGQPFIPRDNPTLKASELNSDARKK